MLEKIKEESKVCKDGKKRKWILIKCNHCEKEVWKEKRFVKNNNFAFCSKQCQGNFFDKKITVKCSYCGKEIKKKIAHSKGNKTNHFFCNRICKDLANKEMNIFRKIKLLECEKCGCLIEVDHRTSSIVCEECKPKTKKIFRSNYWEVIKGNEKCRSFQSLKFFLLKEELKQNICEKCQTNEWMGETIICQLHHKDGNRDNNKINNLEMLCPNCHTLTENWGSKKRNMVDII